MVIMKSVTAKPSRTRTSSLPRQWGSSRSSIAVEPCPWGDSRATRRYMGRAAPKVTNTSTNVATGESSPAARAAMAGWWPSVEK